MRAVVHVGRRRLVQRGRSAVPVGTITTSTASADPSVSSELDFDVRVVVIDDRHDRRQLMSYVVEQADADVSVVGYADGPVSALQAVDRLKANTAVLEIQLPVTQGLDTISALIDDFPALRIVVCSFHHQATTKRAALARGADAYLVKPLSPRDLHQLLRATGLGKTMRDIHRKGIRHVWLVTAPRSDTAIPHRLAPTQSPQSPQSPASRFLSLVSPDASSPWRWRRENRRSRPACVAERADGRFSRQLFLPESPGP